MNFQNSIAIEVSLFETIRAKGILRPLGKRRASSKVSTRALEACIERAIGDGFHVIQSCDDESTF